MIPLRPALCAALCLLICAGGSSVAGIDYSVPGSTLTENFDTLPVDAPSNASIETLYLNGWMDDSITTAGSHVGLPGWFLHHPLTPGSENGFNDHQRLRFGPGSNTGSFWVFSATASDSEKALGSIGSLTVAANNASMYMALRLVNDTGGTLGSFTLTFDGEQWRDGQSTEGETLFFDYSLTATAADWFSTAVFIPVPALNFTSPVTAGVSSGGTAVNGNAEGLVPGLTATVSGISWAPGAELWLRWADPQLPGPGTTSYADDGLAIDNLTFRAFAATVIPDADIAFSRNGTGQLQITWQGAAGISWQLQHSIDLAEWTLDGTPAPETAGPMSHIIPSALLTAGRHYFRLQRTVLPGAE